eukprot:scaffold2580_cov388-Prasinococcus_capsulatus_cf.AAC.11
MPHSAERRALGSGHARVGAAWLRGVLSSRLFCSTRPPTALRLRDDGPAPALAHPPPALAAVDDVRNSLQATAAPRRAGLPLARVTRPGSRTPSRLLAAPAPARATVHATVTPRRAGPARIRSAPRVSPIVVELGAGEPRRAASSFFSPPCRATRASGR